MYICIHWLVPVTLFTENLNINLFYNKQFFHTRYLINIQSTKTFWDFFYWHIYDCNIRPFPVLPLCLKFNSLSLSLNKSSKIIFIFFCMFNFMFIAFMDMELNWVFESKNIKLLSRIKYSRFLFKYAFC